MYERGQGVTKDEKKAAEYYKKCAESGNAKAKYNLGRAYIYGVGVEKDWVAAYRWLYDSKWAGELAASKLMEELEHKMSKEELKEATRLVEALKLGSQTAKS